MNEPTCPCCGSADVSQDYLTGQNRGKYGWTCDHCEHEWGVESRPDGHELAGVMVAIRARIEAEERACVTAPDMTGAVCKCEFPCRNRWLRAEALVPEVI